MQTLASLYPALPDRRPLPVFYTPACFALSTLPFVTEHRKLAIISTFPLLLYLCVTWPCYTTGDPSSDYYNNSHFIALPLWYLDFVLLTPRDGDGAPAYIGAPKRHKIETRKSVARGKRWRDLTSFSQRVKWGLRLMLPAQRGIGWNWQVKSVPADPDAELPRWMYVRRQLWRCVVYYLQSVVVLTLLGFACDLKAQVGNHDYRRKIVLDALVGWAGAVWVWDRLSCAYSVAAALGISSGITETWEWPPLMGSLKDAWSVRQMWSVTYHQACRRLLSQPSICISRFLGLHKGSLASRYTQLFVSFGISCLFHQAQMFNITRRDMGEMTFFMSQPFAIATEDLICWLWKRSGLSSNHNGFGKMAGYVWVFIWFSFSLRFYVVGLLQAGVMVDWVFGDRPLLLGVAGSRKLLRLLGP